jgi:hypothetical protein
MGVRLSQTQLAAHGYRPPLQTVAHALIIGAAILLG